MTGPLPLGRQQCADPEGRGLVKTYHGDSALFGTRRIVPAVNEVSFDLARAHTGVIGNGSGKSSLGCPARSIAGR
jgi:peptide/nickel transport system ATP-binding protein